jgi:APA family basic amino acid/polyamine antiporter
MAQTFYSQIGANRRNSILLVIAVIVLRKKRPDADRPYRMRGYPMVPIISVVLAAFLILDLAWLAPTTSGIGYLFVLSGIPVYFIWRRRFSGDRTAGSTL